MRIGLRLSLLLLPLCLIMEGCNREATHLEKASLQKVELSEDNPKQILSLTWTGPLGFSEARPGGWIQRRIEAEFGVRFAPQFLDPVAYSKTRPLRFIAGEVPDLFWDGDPLGVRSKARHGFVLELPYEVLLRFAPHYVAFINRQAPEAWMYARWRGRNWGIPTVVPNAVHPTISLWRKDWLEKVGIDKVPETAAEAHEAFRRFTFNDPDGNGRNDTYGFSPPVGHWSYFFSEFFAAEGVLAFDLQEVNGAVTWGGIRPEAKRVLAMLRAWYAEGIINPDFVLGQPSMADQALLDGRIGYVSMQSARSLDPSVPASLVSRLRQINPAAALAPAAPLAGMDGIRRARVWGAAGHVLQLSEKLAQEPAKVVRILRILDGLAADPGLHLEAIMGERGVHWDSTDERGAFLLPPYTESLRATREMLGANQYEGFGFFAPFGLPVDQLEPLRAAWKRKLMETYARPEWGIFNPLGKTDVLERTSDTLGDLRQFQQKFYTDIIRGDRPLDDFERFVDQWKQRGGSAILTEAHEFLRERGEIYRLLGVPHHSPVSSLTSESLPQ